MIYGFNEDHVSILSSKQVLSQYNAILADLYQKTKASDTILGNRLHVDFSFDFPKEQPKPMPTLLLRPVDKKGTEIMFYLSPEDTGREHGPFPSGKYEVSLLAPAFVAEPAGISTSIEEGTVPSVEFFLKPVGYLRGYVAKNEQHIQVGAPPQPDTEVQIHSITLSGSGAHRTTIPLREEESYSEYFLSATDFTAKGAFFFFGLPAGEYELTINAKGYEQYSEMCNVRLGQYQNTMVINLVKEIVDSP